MLAHQTVSTGTFSSEEDNDMIAGGMRPDSMGRMGGRPFMDGRMDGAGPGFMASFGGRGGRMGGPGPVGRGGMGMPPPPGRDDRIMGGFGGIEGGRRGPPMGRDILPPGPMGGMGRFGPMRGGMRGPPPPQGDRMRGGFAGRGRGVMMGRPMRPPMGMMNDRPPFSPGHAAGAEGQVLSRMGLCFPHFSLRKNLAINFRHV